MVARIRCRASPTRPYSILISITRTLTAKETTERYSSSLASIRQAHFGCVPARPNVYCLTRCHAMALSKKTARLRLSPHIQFRTSPILRTRTQWGIVSVHNGKTYRQKLWKNGKSMHQQPCKFSNSLKKSDFRKKN